MPRQAKAVERSLPAQTLVIDNGAYTIKAGFASSEPQTTDCQIIPNCVARDRGKRVWVGSQLDKCVDFGEIVFRRPVEKGFVVSWEVEKAIWDNTFIDSGAPLKVRLDLSSARKRCSSFKVRPTQHKSCSRGGSQHSSGPSNQLRPDSLRRIRVRFIQSPLGFVKAIFLLLLLSPLMPP